MARLATIQTELFEPKAEIDVTWEKQQEGPKQPYTPTKKSKAKTDAGKKRAKAAGLSVQ